MDLWRTRLCLPLPSEVSHPPFKNNLAEVEMRLVAEAFRLAADARHIFPIYIPTATEASHRLAVDAIYQLKRLDALFSQSRPTIHLLQNELARRPLMFTERTRSLGEISERTEETASRCHLQEC